MEPSQSREERLRDEIQEPGHQEHFGSVLQPRLVLTVPLDVQSAGEADVIDLDVADPGGTDIRIRASAPETGAMSPIIELRLCSKPLRGVPDDKPACEFGGVDDDSVHGHTEPAATQVFQRDELALGGREVARLASLAAYPEAAEDALVAGKEGKSGEPGGKDTNQPGDTRDP